MQVAASSAEVTSVTRTGSSWFVLMLLLWAREPRLQSMCAPQSLTFFQEVEQCNTENSVENDASETTRVDGQPCDMFATESTPAFRRVPVIVSLSPCASFDPENDLSYQPVVRASLAPTAMDW